MILRRAAEMALVVGWVAALAQQRVPAPAMGTVTGQVMCADTQRPARFAQVVLINKVTLSPVSGLTSPANIASEAKLISANGVTGLDGKFVVQQVLPGDYYVVATAAGYVVPLGTTTDGKITQHVDEVMRDVPLVHVAAEAIAQANITLHRGAVIAGRVTFDDGSPAAKVYVSLMDSGVAEHYEAWPGIFYTALALYQRNQTVTDDEGRYRFAGVAPGKYDIRAKLVISFPARQIGDASQTRPLGIPGTLLPVYFPDKFRRGETKAIKIAGVEQMLDADIQIDLRSLHTVKGNVHTKDGNHVPDRAQVRLADAQDESWNQVAVVHPDGSYEFSLVPPGTYTLRVQLAADTSDPFRAFAMNDATVKELKTYSADDIDVIVSERDVVAPDILLEVDEDSPV
jgi:hypothetical protein